MTKQRKPLSTGSSVWGAPEATPSLDAARGVGGARESSAGEGMRGTGAEGAWCRDQPWLELARERSRGLGAGEGARWALRGKPSRRETGGARGLVREEPGARRADVWPQHRARDKLRKNGETTLKGWSHPLWGPGGSLGRISKDADRGRKWTWSPRGPRPAPGPWLWGTAAR